TGWGLCHCFIVGLCGMCAFAEACVLPIILVIIPFMACDLSLNTSQVTAVYATLTLGMAIGAFVFGTIIDASGRKDCIPVTMLVVFCATITLSFAQTILLIYLSIFILGIGLAGNNVVLRVYLIEILPIKRRGFCLVILDLLGIIGYIFALGLGGMPNLIMACATSLLPTSPRYLLYRRRYEEALAVLRQIYAINNSKHADTYSLHSLNNCVRPNEEDEEITRNVITIMRRFCIKTCKRIREICSTSLKCTTLLGICINFLQFPGIIWIALWNTQLLQETENFNKSSKKNSTCIISVENLALGFLQNCQEVDTDRFSGFFYLSLSYILGEILLLIGIDVIGRKIFLMLSGLMGTAACLGLLFTAHQMVDNEKFGDHSGQKAERNVGRACTSRVTEQRTSSKGKHKVDESELPAPPPDPWASLWRLQNPRDQTETGQSRNVDEDEDMIAYLTDYGTLPFEGQTSECPSRNSAVSAMAISGVYAEDAFEHLDRLYAFAEQILELRDRNSKFFKRVRNLERLKILRSANHKLENAFARDKDAIIDVCEEDTGFAESLLDAMLSNCRDSPFQKRNIRSSSSRQLRNKFDMDKQASIDEISGSAPKVSKWTRVKAAFKWERAYTNDAEIIDPSMTTSTSSTTTVSPSSPTTKYHKTPDVEIRESSNTTTFSPVIEPCNVGTLSGRTSPPASFNEGFYDCSQKSALNHLDYKSLKRKPNKEPVYGNWHSESLDDNILILDTSQVNETGLTNEVNKILLIDEKDTEPTSKRSTPTLTITIPSHEEDIRYTSSPESNSPLFFNMINSTGNSPQHRKTYRDLSMNKDFKRQQSFGGESILTSKIQRSDSKWNKVRRAFLTNSTLSVPSNLINVVSRQMLFQDGNRTFYHTFVPRYAFLKR
ncbi:Synaptic vesicle glycoprotein 2B, partial [Melipona quadrifasciata]